MVSVNADKENVALHTQNASLERSRDAYRVRARVAEAKIASEWARADAVKSEYQNLMASAQKDNKASQTLLLQTKAKVYEMVHEADIIVSQAKARERGAGPPANRSCQQTLRKLVINRETGWLSDAVKVGEGDRFALSRVCLGE